MKYSELLALHEHNMLQWTKEAKSLVYTIMDTFEETDEQVKSLERIIEIIQNMEDMIK